MNIAIIGTRGIPNNYGGFEQLAEYLSVALVQHGFSVSVYNSSLHPYPDNQFKGVKIITCYDPEDWVGTVGQFIYDWNCIWHCRQQTYDVILQLGYTSSSVWSFLFPKKTKVVTNMDGLEWKRSKYGTLTKFFLKYAEKWAVNYSDALVADSIGIQRYIQHTYKKEASYIAYGTNETVTYNDAILNDYNLASENYYLIIARLEPENNIELIIKGYLLAQQQLPLVIIGSTQTKFGSYLKQKYASINILFKETLYTIEKLNSLRKHCKLYFHGHSVGGTNPSLLEAMASHAFIGAHDNEFNRAILQTDALYFKNEFHIKEMILNRFIKDEQLAFKLNNFEKTRLLYSWPKIVEQYQQLFIKI